ncbi:MAG: VWA domain-containing protein [Acidobacteriales bacterium]|nr:MAG: VWA domain-containing protein [Terriglobales bacterium]
MKRLAVLIAVCLAVWVPADTAQQAPTREGAESVAKPAKKDADKQAEPEKIPSQFGRKPDLPAGTPTYRSDVTTVNLDVAVLDSKGRFIPGIPRGNFRILENNVPQKIGTFEVSEAPMTVCLVIEFSNLFQSYWSQTWYQTLQAAYGFLETLKKEDYVAVVAYDMRPEILSDFSTDRKSAYEAMRRLNTAAYSEANLFDAITDTADRMSSIEGRKAIVLLSSGLDTFSKKNFDETRKILQNASVPVYAIGLMQTIRIYMEAYMGAIARLDFLQADNQLRTFAKETGGQAFFPRFEGEMPSIFRAIADSLRNQYTLTYQPSDQTRDGKFRKIKVELVDPATNQPLRVVDENKKPVRYTIIAKSGYTAPRAVE